jgi:predicted flap endonuclease-1-like 5' DNA nuclease
MSPGFLSDKRAVAAIIIAIPLAIVALVYVRPIDFNISMVIFGASLVLFLFACLLDTADEFQSAPVAASTPEGGKTSRTPDEHAEVYVPEVVKPTVEPSKLPIETIEGIGPVYGKLLRKAGYPTVADMVAVDAERVAEICNVNIEQAERWIAMSRFAWLDEISEEDAEAIVFATGITDLETLSDANAEDLFAKVKAALANGSVQVPADYKITLEKVKAWINAARDLG